MQTNSNAKGRILEPPAAVFCSGFSRWQTGDRVIEATQTETNHPQDGSTGLLHLMWAAPPGLDCSQAKVTYFNSPALVEKNIWQPSWGNDKNIFCAAHMPMRLVGHDCTGKVKSSAFTFSEPLRHLKYKKRHQTTNSMHGTRILFDFRSRWMMFFAWR